jgi:hypothetical protein
MDFDDRAARSSTQSITRISLEETAMLEAIKAIDLQETNGDAIHLMVRDGRRHWLARTAFGEVSASVDEEASVTDRNSVEHREDGSSDAGVHLPLSDRITWFLNSIDDDEPMIGLANGTTAVISGSHTSAAIDLVPWKGPAPQRLEITLEASATMPLTRFARTLAAARLMPSGLEEFRYPTPPMWLRISDRTVVLSVDWRDFAPTGSVYSIDADVVEGSAVVAIDHSRIDRFLRGLDSILPIENESDSVPGMTPEVMIGVGHAAAVTGVGSGVGSGIGETGASDAGYAGLGTTSAGLSRTMLVIGTDEWRLVLPVVDVLAERWATQVNDQLRGFAATEVTSTSWVVDLEQCVVEVGLHHGHPDQVRVTTCLATGVTDSEDLLRELSTLNAASTGERLWCAEGCLWAAMDLPCTRIDDLRTAVTQISTVAHKYAPLLAALG